LQKSLSPSTRMSKAQSWTSSSCLPECNEVGDAVDPGRTSAPRLPQTLQVKRSSISDSLASSGQRLHRLTTTPPLALTRRAGGAAVRAHVQPVRRFVEDFKELRPHAEVLR
jgi:hypothetical protein